MKLNKLKIQKGFTIIEVMIVLAIAGLIMVIVFLAVPNLQKSERNTSRKSVADRIKTEIDNYASNNGGNLPTALSTCGAGSPKSFGDASCTTGFFGKYLGCPGANPNYCASNINDPQSGKPLGIGGPTGSGTTTYVTGGLTAGVDVGSLNYSTGTICDGETPTTTGATLRNYTLQMQLEPKNGATYCLDNH